MKKLLKGVWC